MYKYKLFLKKNNKKCIKTIDDIIYDELIIIDEYYY